MSTGPIAYATLADLAAYMPDLPVNANATILNKLLSASSRFVDTQTGQFFWDDGLSTKYFHSMTVTNEMDGKGYATLDWPFFGVQSITMAYFENQPLNQWLTLTGDGMTPPTNFFLFPENPKYAGSSSNPLALKPWYGVDLAFLPSSGTTYLPIFVGGHKTFGLTAHWGWPAVPDLINDLVCKMVVRAFRAREAGEDPSGGGGSVSLGSIKAHFDEKDLELLESSDFVFRWM